MISLRLPGPDALSSAGLRLDLAEHVATISLDRPERRNAQTPLMWRTLGDLGAALPDDVRVVVVRGEGPSFSAGLDRTLLAPGGAPEGVESVVGLLERPDAEIAETVAVYQRAFTFLRGPRFVSVAAVQGHAVGAGFQLALACDLRVVSEDATFQMKESALGLVPDLAGTKPLVESVGYARALEICATARAIGAREAVQIGLALTAVPAEELEATVSDLVAALTAPMPGVVPETKALLQGAAQRDLDEQCRREREAQVRRFRDLARALDGDAPTKE